MESDPSPILQELQMLAEQARGFGQSLTRPGWRMYQIGILLGLFALAQIGAWMFYRRLYGWLRAREGWPIWRFRTALILLRRLRIILLVILAWITVWAMRELTWPSRSYLVAIGATLASAWLFVGLAARLVRNPFLRRLVTWGLWVYVTLYVIGLDDEAAAVLDSLRLGMGDLHLSALTLIRAAVVTGVLFTGARLIATTSAARIRRDDDISPSMRVLIVKILQMSLYGAAVFLGLKLAGFDLTGLAVLSGAIGVGLGFGLQKVVSNLVSGVIILLDKSIKPGDVISLGDTFGWINALGARYVSVVTREGKEYLIPNEDLITSQVVNWSHSNEFVRLDIFFGTSYGDDPHLVRRLAVEAAAGVDRVLAERPPVCHVVGFGDSSVDFILRFWIVDPSEGLTNVRGAVFLALWDAFKANGVTIPFPQREVTVLPGSRLAAEPLTDTVSDDPLPE
ncbi:mechanosensitive ion channel [Rhodovulum sulfidophilum]|uniref:mechanosensitive ion channel family protein n=1 Tax=Rhodovulum sulfidophilum TaxID=35806 RepID=UPI0019230AB9|nr:mechanosensitive ion channel domain-containing protein [Rhodovulum sulfidophilum]MBL3574208.1 mechanosensitive ion channel [Rhodovulum sulfidophilum]MCE8431302.1 mechanosensitive ion channel [Rhodovulum sulfidophilum]MCF4118797.1 mechanosensitive ion channel [Rhodovulum sulfidophilum]